MKKIFLIFAILSIFVLQLSSVKAEDNVNLESTYNNMNTEVVSCGSGMISDVPSSIPKAVNIVYTALQIVVPIIIVIFGMIDLVKAVIAQKEDEIKKAQMTFVKRLIAGALVFFVFVIIKLLVSFVADNSTSASKIMDCADCFLNGIENCKVSK